MQLKSESFMENFINNNSSSQEDFKPINIKHLKERFTEMYDTLKQTAESQDKYLSKISKVEDKICDSENSLLKEEQPKVLDFEPTSRESKVFSPIDVKSLDNRLQTSILNINEEIKGGAANQQNLFSESKTDNNLSGSFESNLNEEMLDTNSANDCPFISNKKLSDLRDRIAAERSLTRSDFKKRSNNFDSSKSFKYKNMLNKVREKSRERINNKSSTVDYVEVPSAVEPEKYKLNESLNSSCRNELKISNANYLEISSANSSNNKFSLVSEKTGRLDNDDELFISYLNSDKSSKFISSMRKKNNLKENVLTDRNEFYGDNLCDLIEEIESKGDFYERKRDLSQKEGIKGGTFNDIEYNYKAEKE